MKAYVKTTCELVDVFPGHAIGYDPETNRFVYDYTEFYTGRTWRPEELVLSDYQPGFKAPEPSMLPDVAPILHRQRGRQPIVPSMEQLSWLRQYGRSLGIKDLARHLHVCQPVIYRIARDYHIDISRPDRARETKAVSAAKSRLRKRGYTINSLTRTVTYTAETQRMESTESSLQRAGYTFISL